MKTIRNKTVNQTIRKYLLDNMDFSGYVGYFDGMDTEPKTNTEKTLAIWKIFQSEKGWEVDRIGKQAAFINWLQGLASAMTVDFTHSLKSAVLICCYQLPLRLVDISRFYSVCRGECRVKCHCKNSFRFALSAAACQAATMGRL